MHSYGKMDIQFSSESHMFNTYWKRYFRFDRQQLVLNEKSFVMTFKYCQSAQIFILFVGEM